jgi:predicted metal-dependent HD superfamily phosphohydrolase
VRALYAQPGRHYHNQTHIDALLAHFAAVRDIVVAPAAVELAIWYHDSVYEPTAHDNEARSVALFRTHLGDSLAPTLVAQVVAMIEATERHLLPTTGSPSLLADCALFLDMDLSILGVPAPVFARYETDIRREYAMVPEDAYRAGRAAVLERFLARDRLYFSERFHGRLEAQARHNLAASLAVLRTRVP